MDDLWRKARHFCLGVLDVTREEVESLVGEMVKRGEVAEEDAARAVAELMEKARSEQEAFFARLQVMMEKIIAGAGLARAADLQALEARVRALESGPVGGPG
jgi:polyhydroxyalkanoate synthesis regulator phasin